MMQTNRDIRTDEHHRALLFRKWLLLSGFVVLVGMTKAHAGEAEAPVVKSAGLTIRLDSTTGLPERIETGVGNSPRSWLDGPIALKIRNEVSGAEAKCDAASEAAWQHGNVSHSHRAVLQGLPLAIAQEWSCEGSAVAWSLDFHGEAARVAHEITLDLPILGGAVNVFTPTERGTMEVAARPEFQGTPYAAVGWEHGVSWVLPLLSVMDPRTDQALTIALPADANIPHLQFSWYAGKTLRLTLGHRGMGGGQPSPLKLLFFAHAADYRAALGAYVAAFPDYFRTPLPRGPYEGTFWYHHIQDHPDPAEMAQQRVRYIWSSFWFTYLGEYLPNAAEWEPYTYAKWWKLAETMNDEKIRAFIRAMHARGIGTYAYFNVTEFGGAGGKTGDTIEAARVLREQFADALIRDGKGNDIPTWEGAMAMNPGSRYSLWPQLEDQVRRHLSRLPEIDGFVIDRLDWASVTDFGHDDGLSMIGERRVENMALPVGEAVRRVVELSHAVGKRVFVNQFYRVEVLRGVDGVCHENDYLPALGYLTPLRPASAWHHRKPYAGDLLAFESQLKLRLQWALFPQMIAHQFPISQQAPDPRAADLLEVYAPLFELLLGKEQVLLPHCVEATGNNDVNLFVNQEGHFIVPITSRTRFISRKSADAEPVTVTLRTPTAGKITWAHAISADGAGYRAKVAVQDNEVLLTADRHGTASMLMAGTGDEPALENSDQSRCAAIRESLGNTPASAPALTERPAAKSVGRLRWRLAGTHVGSAGPIQVVINGVAAGLIPENENQATGDWTPVDLPDQPPRIALSASDEGTWFVPERLEVLAPRPDGSAQCWAVWLPSMGIAAESTRNCLILPTAWSVADIPATTATWLSRDLESRGRWRERVGSAGVWIAGMGDAATGKSPGGYGFEVLGGTPYRWPASPQEDLRVLEQRQGTAAEPACWFANEQLRFHITAPDSQPYRLTLYVVDYDRNGRGARVTLNDEFAPLASVDVSSNETANGVYLTWTVSGSVYVVLDKTAGFNVVLSGVFVDR
jgi:hypothetical protein